MKTQTWWIPVGSFLLAVVLASLAGPGQRSSAQDRGPGRETYLKDALDRLIIDSTTTSGSTSTDKPAETLNLNFMKVDYDYAGVNKQGNPPPPPPKKGWFPKLFSAVDRVS